ncbi:MAG: Crp/Fnr family transcriptional regulator [Bacteroidales bacterium]|nr:Crp/Fnr family transcriptional regulator [Bacteroidales bacterium]NCA74829.1 Crp/Fnr family transcriptional regulator [Alphaproteobacteria bacterium]HNW72683.1 Crp/Fnr family transcriptional regulator [Bacteroidales bacterium]HPS49219.1 Crp/Fnr family transcriptional regulator [Bacteroidales bacterium]
MVNKNTFASNCVDCNCKSSIFKHLSHPELDIISNSKFQVVYKAGEIIFKQGTPSPYFVCITSGLVKIYIEGYGKNLILGLVKPVDYIFGPGIYVDNRHHYSAAAVEDCTACLIDVNVFKRLIRENPDFADEFIKRVSLQAIFNFEQVISLTQKQMPGRIADVLFYLSEKIYCQNPFELSITRQDLADLSGMSKESAIRILKEFKEEGVLTLHGNHLEILNIKQLRHISEKG